MKDKYPDRKVGLVTFESNILIIGDGTKKPIQLERNYHDDFVNILKTAVVAATTQLSSPICKTYDNLKQQVEQLRATGGTALGPGMLAAVGVACEGSLGSQVIVCTDGESGEGIGAHGEQDVYDRIGEYASSKGATVHIVTFKGTQCNIDAISRVAEMTNGDVERVDADNIGDNFKNFLAK